MTHSQIRTEAARIIEQARYRPVSPDRTHALDAAFEAKGWAGKNLTRAQAALAEARAALRRC